MRTQRIETKDGIFWRKYPEPPYSKLWMFKLLNLFSRATGLGMFAATASTGGVAALRAEADRLKRFHDKGVCVPELTHVTDEFIEMKDLGQEMGKLIDSLKGHPDRQLVYIKKAARGLAEMHQKGLAHGRPHLKDMVWSRETGQVGFLDLEENVAGMPIKQAQARDVWLFMGSVSGYLNYDTSRIDQVYQVYRSRYACKTVHAHLSWFVRKVKPLFDFAESLFKEKLGRDVKDILVCHKVIGRYL